MKIEKDELTIYEVEALHKELLEEFKKDEVSIDMSGVNKVDMSVIQLFVSLQKSCNEVEKHFELTDVSEEVRDTFKNCASEFLLGVKSE